MPCYWQRTLPILLGAMCVFFNTADAESPLIPALLGINLGSTDITAATINGSGTFPLALVEGSQGYIDFMNNTTDSELPLEEYYEEAISIVKLVLHDVRIRASHINNKDMRIGAILTPAHFTYEMRMLVFESWDAENDGVFVQPVRPVSFSAIVHPENDCVDRIYNPTLPWDQGEWVLMFHQDFDYLSLSLSMVSMYVFDTISRNLAVPASTDDIIDFLRYADDYKDHAKTTSIVLSSHDGRTDFRLVREALDEVDVQLWGRRKTSPLELKYVAAAGVACLARQRAIFPDEGVVCEYPPPLHDEMTSPLLHVEL